MVILLGEPRSKLQAGGAEEIRTRSRGRNFAESASMGLLRRTQSPGFRRDDRKLVGRTEPDRGLEVVAAEGSRVRDARGRSFIDFEMGWCVGNLGWNPPEILARVRGFTGPSYVAPQSTYAPWSPDAAVRASEIWA
jgi:4-aminobutyrate aminotransferase-like enzyme